MKNNLKRVLSLVLAFSMVFSYIPTPVYATSASEDNIIVTESDQTAEGAGEEGSVEDSHEHSYTAVVTDPTCTEKGYTTYTCECEDSYTADEADALGHSYADGVCSVCGEAEPDAEQSIAVVTEDEETEAATEGYMLYIHNADGSLGMTIDGTKSESDFSIKSAIEDARTFVDSAVLFGITTPATYVVEMYEDSTEAESFEIGSDVTINGTLNNAEIVTTTPAATGLGGEGTETDPYLISTLNDLILFRDSVNAGETTYNTEGVYVALGADIDMANTDWSENIGDDCSATFDGIFDGKGYTISNLTSTETAQKGDGYICTGLFGAIYGSAVVKNLTLENVTIKTGDYTGNNVGAVVGFAYSCTGSVENVTVKGDISISAANASSVGAVVGYAYSGSLTIVNCVVDGNDNSSITAKSQVGGIVGYAGGKLTATGNTVQNIAISGTGLVGGVAGILCGGTAANNTVKNVGLAVTGEYWQNSAAIVAGTISEPSTFTGNTFEGVTVNDTATTTIVGSEYVNKPTESVKAVQAKVGDVYYATLAAAITAAVNGDTVTLLSAVEQADGIIITDKNITIDLNGKTFTVTDGASTNNRNFKINGTSVVTIKNGTMVAKGDYSSGAYGTVRTEDSANVTLTGLKLYNYRGNGLNIKALEGTTVSVSDTEIYSNYGGGIEAAGGTITVENVKVEQKGMYTSPWNSMAISVNSSGKVTVNGGTYSTECITAAEADNQGTSNGPWVAGVLNSGGTLVINGGTFSNDNYGDNSLATYARGAILADTGAVVEINGGTFNALKDIVDIQNNLGDASKQPSATISGGTFSADPTAITYSSFVTIAEGYELVANSNGTYTVAAKVTGPAVDVESDVQFTDDTEKESFTTAVSEALKDANATVTLDEVTVKKYDATNSTVTYDISSDNYTTGTEVPMTLPVVGIDNGETAYVVHEHTTTDGTTKYVYAGTVANDCVTFTNKVGFSDFTVTDVNGLADAFAEDGNVVLGSDVTLTSQEFTYPNYNRLGYTGLLIPDDKTVVLDLAGHTVSYSDAYGDYDNCMIINIGDLTINDSVGGGRIYYKSNDNDLATKTYTYLHATILNGGKLTLNDGVTVENNAPADTDCTNAIENHSHFSYQYENDAICIVNNAIIVSNKYYAIRQYTHYKTGYENDLTINDGTVTGIYMQHGDSWYYPDETSGRQAKGSLTINGGTIKTLQAADDYTCYAVRVRMNNPDNPNWKLAINGGTIDDVVLQIQKGYYYVNGASGTITSEATGESTATWLEANGGFISGGTFSEEVAAEYCAEGYIPTSYTDDEGNTVYGVKVGTYVAQVGDVKYETLAEAMAAATNGDTVTLLSDMTIDSETYTIADGVSITLDMNGKKLSITDNKTTNYELFYIYGGMTVKGNGTIELTATTNRNWNASSSIFHNRGGVLTIENGTFRHLGGTDMAYVVDNSGNWYGDATTTINGGTLESTYTAIRNRMEQNSHGASGTAYLNISGGTITGTTSAIWAQAASTSTTSPATGEIKISGGTVGLINTARSDGAECMTTISGGTVKAFKGEVGELTVTSTGTAPETVTMLTADNVAAEYVVTADGVYAQAVASVTDSEGIVTNYATLAEAMAAVKDGDTVTILAGDYTQNLNVNKTITVVGATDADGNNLVNITGKLNVTADGAEVKNINVNNDGDTAGYISAKDVLIEGCTVVGKNGFRYCYTSGTVTFKDSTITGSVYGIHFDGSAGGNIVIDNCIITGWTSFASAIEKVTIKDTEFAEGNYNYVRFYQNAEISGCTFNEKMTVDISDSVKANVTVVNSTVDNGTVEDLFEGADIVNSTITVNGDELARAAKIGDVYYETLAEAMAAVKDGDTVTLLSDVTMSEILVINKAITLDGNGHKLTSTMADTEGRAINVREADGVTIKNLTINASGQRAINVIQNATNVIIDNVTATAANYTVNVASSAANAVVTITNSDLTGLNVVNVAAANAQVTVSDTKITCNDQTEEESYIALCLNKDATGATITATNIDWNIEGDSLEAVVTAENGTITIDGSTDEVVVQIAYISYGDNYYGFTSLERAFNKAKDGEKIVLIRDFKLTESVTIPAGKTVILDLNGKTITGTDNATGSFGLININPGAALTINDSSADGTGKITLTATNDRDWNAYSSVISNQRGTLTVNGGTIEHLGGTDMAYGIDNLTNGKGTKAETVINGGTVKSTYRAIRQFLNGTEAENILTVNGGTIEGTNKSIWMQDTSTSANSGTLTVSEKATLVGDVYLFVTAGSTEWPVEVSIAAEALAEGSEVVTGNVPEGYEVAESDGTYGVYSGAAKIGTTYYETLAAAIEEAQSGDTIDLLADVEASEVILIGKSVTINGNGYKVTSSATRVFRVTTNDVEVTLNNVNMVSTAVREGTNDIRGISVDGNLSNVKLTLNNCSVDFTDASACDWAYAVNVVKGTNDSSIVIDGGTYEGANVINIWGNNTVTIKDATLTSLYAFNANYVGNNIRIENGATVTATNVTFEGSHAKAVGYSSDATGEATLENCTDNTKYYVVTVGETPYYTLAEAIAAAVDGDTITLIADITVNEDDIFNLTGLTLDLNNNTIKTGRLAGIFVGNTFIIKNGTIDGQGASYGLWIGDETKAENVTVDGVTVKGGINIYNSSNVLLKNNNVNADVEVAANDYYAIWLDEYVEGVVVESGAYTSAEGKESVLAYETSADGISIEGGTFSSAVAEEYCAEGYIPTSYTDDEGNTVYGVKVGTYVAQVGDVKYETVTEALADAANGDTVTLLADSAEAGLVLANGVTLDLNGFTLTADYVAAFAGNYIVDNSTDKTGLLKVAENKMALMSLDADSKQIPVWNEVDGYIFLTVKEQQMFKSTVTEDQFIYMFRPSQATFNELMKNGASDNGLKVKVRLSWDDASGITGSKDFVYSDELIKTAYNEGGALTLTVTGFNSYLDKNLKVSFVVEFGTLYIESTPLSVSVD